MHRVELMWLFLLASLAFALPAFAQTDPSPINDCASTLTYDLPKGWVAGDQLRNQYGVAARLASSDAAFDSAALEAGDAVILVNVIGRRFLTQPMRLAEDADLTEILAGVTAQAEAPFAPGEITRITLQGQSAARVEVHSATLDMLMFALDLDSEVVALVSLSAPAGEIDQWEATAHAFAESLMYGAPRHEHRHWLDTVLAVSQSLS